MDDYTRNWESFRDDPVKYWEKKVECFKWFKPYHTAFDNSDPDFPKWFCGGELNLCYDILDRHVEQGHGDDVIFIFDSYYTKETTRVTYGNLLEDVSKLAGAFHTEAGIQPGDHVLIYMPMIPEALTSMLATVRLGGVYTVCTEAFKVSVIVNTVEKFRPKLVVVSSIGFAQTKLVNMKDMLDTAIQSSTHKPEKCMVFQRTGLKPSKMNPDRDIDFLQSKNKAVPHDCVPVECNEPLLLIYTSGTTGNPKGLVVSSRAMAVGITQDGSSIFRSNEQEIFHTSSAYYFIGGQIRLVYLSLFWNTPCLKQEDHIRYLDLHYFFGLLSKFKVVTVKYSTEICNAIMQKDINGTVVKQHQPYNIKNVYAGGFPGDMKAFDWIKKHFRVQVIQNYGGTEYIGSITTPKIGIASQSATEDQMNMSSQKPVPGWQIEILRKDGSQADTGEVGNIVIRLPLPPAILSTIYGNDERYKKEYLSEFPGYFSMNDLGRFDIDGFLYLIGRGDDDVFYATGHRTTCFDLEEKMMSHTDVADCMIVTRTKEKNGIRIVSLVAFFVTVKDSLNLADTIGKDLVTLVKKEIGKRPHFSEAYQVDAIPRTGSGKITRGIIRDLIKDIDNNNLKELTDPVLSSFARALKC